MSDPCDAAFSLALRLRADVDEERRRADLRLTQFFERLDRA